MRIDDPNAAGLPIRGQEPYQKGRLSPEQLAAHPKRAERLKSRIDQFEQAALSAAPSKNDLSRSPAALNAQLRRAEAQLSTAAGAQQPTGPKQAGRSTLDAVLNAFGAVKGDKNFREALDIDGDGRIGFGDLNALLSGPESTDPLESAADPSKTFTAQDLDDLLNSFNARKGDENFRPDLDLDGDGVIGFSDLNALIQGLGDDVQSEPATRLKGLLSSYNASEGAEGFDARFDFDGDGVVSFTDLNTLLEELTSGAA